MSPYHVLDDEIRNIDSSGIGSLDVVSFLAVGRSQISSKKTKDFFDLDLMNSKSNSCRMKIHLEYLPPNNCDDNMCVMGLQLETTIVLRSSM